MRGVSGGHLGLSADPSALLGAALAIAVTAAGLMVFGRLPVSRATYLDLGGRFVEAFLAGHLCGFGSAFLLDKLRPTQSR